MGIRGDDARIQIQKLGDVDQIDKQQQQTQRGEAGAIRSKADKEREHKQTAPTELQKQDRVLVRESPFRKRKEHGKEAEEQEKDEDNEGEQDDEEVEDIGGSLDVKG